MGKVYTRYKATQRGGLHVTYVFLFASMAARFQILQGCVQSRIEITQKGRFLIFDSN